MTWIVLGFLSPLLIPALALFVRSKFPPGALSSNLTNAKRQSLEALIGAVGFGVCLSLVQLYSGYERAYDNDPTCRQGLELAQTETGGACTVEDATLTASWWIGRGLIPTFEIVAHRANGSRKYAYITIGTDGMRVWQVVHAHGGIAGRIQIFQGYRMTMVEAAGTSGATYYMPSVEITQVVPGMALGAGFIFAALLEFVLAPLVLKPGQ
jgi:hypothetical protein